MKNIYCILAFILFGIAQVFAQTSSEISTKGVTFPQYTDANRPVGPITIGTTIYNTSQSTHQTWNGSAWQNLVTSGGGSGPWSVSGNSVFVNSNNRVGINSSNPAADLEIQGGGGLLVSSPYTVTTSPPTNTYTMPYNGTLPTITDNAGRILDPGGNGNFVTNTSYASYIKISPTGGANGFRFTFESLDVGGSSIIFSTSSDVNNTSAYILSINQYSGTGQPFIINGDFGIYIHNKIDAGAASAAGFQLLFEKLTTLNSTNTYTEAIGSGLVFNPKRGSFSTGTGTRATGYASTASGFYSRASGNYSTASGRSKTSGDFSTASGDGSVASGYASTASGYSTASGSYSTASGLNSTASGTYSTAMGISANTNNKYESFAIGGASSGSQAVNDKDYQMKMHFDEFQFLTGTSKEFVIRDGEIQTDNSLSIYGFSNTTLSGFGFLNRTTPTGIFSPTSTIPFSIYAYSRVVGQEFNAFSDARHKKLRSYSNGKTDLALLNQLKVSNYTFIDTVGKGGKMQLGFIAQEVEKIVPDAINKIQDYIPSIYDMARSIAYDATAHTLTVTTNKPHDFQAKDEIKLISLDKEHKVKVASIIDANTFVVANWEKPVDKIFVFGKQVNDFRTVDYDRLFTLGISSIQELSRRLEQLEEENYQMKSQVVELKAMLLKTENKENSVEK